MDVEFSEKSEKWYFTKTHGNDTMTALVRAAPFGAQRIQSGWYSELEAVPANFLCHDPTGQEASPG